MFSNGSAPQDRRPLLITFSGIDGAGKSTQIVHLTSFLETQGLRVLRLSFWDDVAVWASMRSGVGAMTVSNADRSSTFSPRNNKHVRKWYLTIVRSVFYMLDAVKLRRLISTKLPAVDVVIFDRYVFDQITNIYSASALYRAYCKFLAKRTPAPDLAFVLDASADAAFARKPEYPLEFVRQNRNNFLQLPKLSPQTVVVSAASEENVRQEIEARVRAVLGRAPLDPLRTICAGTIR